MYVDDFRSAVRQEPQAMMGLVLEHKDKVLPAFIDSLFSGVELSESLNEIELQIVEKMFYSFPCDLKTHRASYFCGIIEKMNSAEWSAETLNKLKYIALKHENPVLDEPNVTSPEDEEMKSCQMLSSNALNCVRGQAARAIGQLLWEDGNLFVQFREVIEKLVFDKNPVVRFAVLYALWPSYNIEQELEKTIILRFINLNLDLEFPLVCIFSKEYIKLEDDKRFLQEIVSSKASKKIVWSFIHYLEENALSIVDYADIIRLCENTLRMKIEELKKQWGIEDEISKLIISLYDETANSQKETDRKTAEKCLELWDIMFERQIGSVREISRKLMER